MKNVLIFAGIAGLAAAIAIYFVTQSDNEEFEEDKYVSDEDIEAYDQKENSGPAYTIDGGFSAI